MKLICDVYSHLRPHHCYGRAGDEVVVVSDCGNVLIVENVHEDRFPVSPDKISFKSDETNDEGQGTAPPRMADLVPPKSKSVSRKNQHTQGGSISNPPRPTLF